jgi:hypothetical protein
MRGSYLEAPIMLCPAREITYKNLSLISAGPGATYLLLISGGRRHRELNRDPNGCRPDRLIRASLIAQVPGPGKSNRGAIIPSLSLARFLLHSFPRQIWAVGIASTISG